MLYKAYVSGSEENTVHSGHLRDYIFSSNPDAAIHYESGAAAELECRFYESAHVTIRSNEGFLHILSGFQIEELANGKFVVYCVGPYVPTVLTQGTTRSLSQRRATGRG
jgi:hypothetical protein